MDALLDESYMQQLIVAATAASMSSTLMPLASTTLQMPGCHRQAESEKAAATRSPESAPKRVLPTLGLTHNVSSSCR